MENLFTRERESKVCVFTNLTKNGDPRQELLVHLSLPDGRAHEYTPVGVTIDTPELNIRLGPDCCCSWCTVDQRKFAEASTLADRRHKLAINEDLHFALVDHVEVVALVACK